MSRLTITASGRRVHVEAGEVASIGRDPTSTMPMSNDERISRRHALVRTDRGNWIFEDLASSNGSFVDGSRIRTVRLGKSTVVRLGAVDGPALRLDVQPPVLRPVVLAGAAITVAAALIVAVPMIEAVIGPFAHVAVVTASPTSSAAVPLTRTEIVAAGKAATVLIVQGNGQGSGVYLGNDRVLTALHVVPTGGRIEVSLNDRLVGSAQTIAIDEQDDLALLFVPGLGAAGARPTVWGDSDRLKEGDELVVLGYPVGLPFSVKVGVVSGLRIESGTSLIQTDASLNPGMSGGPALDPSGRLVGITDFGSTRYAGLNFLVAATSAHRFVNDHP